ncbi:UTP15 protein, partial [Polypterus senegalus]|nr:UTP15 protein [Polypterus senegalus]
MTAYKPTKIQSYPKLGEKVTQDTIYWKNYKTPIQIKEFAAVTKIDFSPVPPYNYAVTASSRIHIYGQYSQEPIKTFSRFKETAYSGSYRDDGKLLVAGSEDGLVRVFDLAGREALRKFSGHTKAVHVANFTSGKYHIFSGGDDYSAKYWDMSTASELISYDEHTDYVRCGSYDHTVRVFDARTDKSVLNMDHGQPVESVLLFPSGGLLVSAGFITDLCLRQAVVEEKPEDEVIAVGMTNGILNIRHRKQTEEKLLMENRKRRKPAYRYYVRGKNYRPKQDDLLVSKPVKMHLKKYDRQLKSFEVTKALDTVLEPHIRIKTPEVTVAVLQELNRRGTLMNALAGRDEKNFSILLNFLIRHIVDPRFARILITVADMVLDIYGSILGQSAVIDKQFVRLQELIEKELDYQQELVEVLGMMDTLFATMTAKKEALAPQSRSNGPTEGQQHTEVMPDQEAMS